MVVKRLILLVFVSAVLLATAASSALADAGPPGSTFPEQPGSNVATGCAAIEGPLLGPSSGRATVAYDIVLGLAGDACLGG